MSEDTKKEETQEKLPYEKPSIESEDLTVYGAACNGTNRGGRKASASDVPPCNPSKLTS